MIDLFKILVVMILFGDFFFEVNQFMFLCGVCLFLVVVSDGCICGVIIVNDLFGEKLVLVVQNCGIKCSELCVSDVMMFVDYMEVLWFIDVVKVEVGYIVVIFKVVMCVYVLVVEECDGKQMLCGIFFVLQIVW